MHRLLSFLAATGLSTLLIPYAAAAQGGPSGPTVRWEIDDDGARWIGSDVAIGDHGAVIAAARENSAPRFTVHSTASSTPLIDLPLPDSRQIRVDAAQQGQLVAALVAHGSPSGGPVTPELMVWRAVPTLPGSAPDWRYTFPSASNLYHNGMGVRVSDDGRTIVAWFSNLDTEQVDLRAFDGTGQLTLNRALTSPQGTDLVDQADLSDDGTRLALTLTYVPHVLEIPSGRVLHVGEHQTMFGGLALSGDGRTYACGDYNLIEVFAETAVGDWALVERHELTGNRLGGAMELDHDGSHLAMTVVGFNPGDRFQVRVRDLRAGIELWRHRFAETGTTGWLRPARILMAEDARVVAGASWGDSEDANPTGFAFDAHGRLTMELRTSGSAIEADMDRSGQVLGMVTKDAHVNHFGSGGDVIVADTRLPELSLLGDAKLGGKMQLRLTGPADVVRLAAAFELGADPTPFGVSQLDLDSLFRIRDFPMSAAGLVRKVTVPDSPSLSGHVLHFQAAFVDAATGRGFLSNRVSLRLLP